MIESQAERPVEVLINNAGGGRPYNLDVPLDAEARDEAIGLNFTAARRLAESALPAMRRARWGRIITITWCGRPTAVPYSVNPIGTAGYAIIQNGLNEY